MRRQPRNVSRLPPARAYRFALEPGDHPHDMHRRGSQQVLQVRARYAAVATLAQSTAPHAVREAALAPRPERILLFACGRLLASAGGRHRLMGGWGADGELAWRLFGGGTGAPGGLVKPAPQHRIAGD